MTNALARAMSPYLLQHKDNPVDWREWSAETLAEAAARDVPILLSVGYAACHWCHVMAHESFEDPAVADLMNASFVNVKVDREERPDLDAIYMQALALLGEQGGWPLTMFLTPNGEPIWGGTYFPPEPRYGRPSFRQVLERLATVWRDNRGAIEGNRLALRDALERLAAPKPGEADPGPLALTTAERTQGQFDPVRGGIGGAPKFPQAPTLRLVWEVAGRTGEGRGREQVVHTLRRICQGGIYDHLGGGFARYAVDAEWLVPHFEKMLYDNAQFLTLLGDAYALTGEPLFKARAGETVGWLEREMLTPAGFAASLDADSEGEEGRFYVWRQDEVAAVLGEEDAARFDAAYGVTGAGNWEGTTILNRLHAPGLAPPEEEAALAAMRARLLEKRGERVRPGRDDKVLADWNGLAVQGLVDAALKVGEGAWLDLARDAFDRVRRHLGAGEGLIHGWRDGRRQGLAFLDDYAQMILAAIALHEATGEAAYLDAATGWAGVARRDFARDDGGYHLWQASAGNVLLDGGTANDGPTPSPQGSLMLALAKLAHLTGETVYEDGARALWRSLAGEVARQPAAYATLLRAGLFLDDPLEITVTGAPDDPATRALFDTAAKAAPIERVLRRVGREAGLPADHPAAALLHATDGPAAFVCRGRSCLPPVTEPDALATVLRNGTINNPQQAAT
ncbi:MAG: thioredoxin domain-containing protein [Geminicoccaceae bacterium]|nr:thioredoxin domain-containing protein [Geminicoccaceae bacterium]